MGRDDAAHFQQPVDPRRRSEYDHRHGNTSASKGSGATTTERHHHHRPSSPPPSSSGDSKSSSRRSGGHSSSSSRSKDRDEPRSKRSRHRSPEATSKEQLSDAELLESLKYKNKKYKFFDIPAKGFANLAPVDYLMMEESGQIPKLIQAPASSLSLNKHNPATGCFVNTQAKRLYVGNIPMDADEGKITDFFNTMMLSNSLAFQQPGTIVTSAQINYEKNFAFIELRSVEETTNAMTLDGVEFMGCALKIKRPRDFQPIQTWSMTGDSSIPANIQMQAIANAGQNEGKLIISNIPVNLNEQDVRSLVQIYGDLKNFELTRESEKSNGTAFVQFSNPLIANEAVKNLNGSTVDGCTLSAQLATDLYAAATQAAMPGIANINVPGVNLQATVDNPTNVLSLLNMVEPDELRDDEEYEDILVDIREECQKYGKINSIEIPRPRDDVEVEGLGKVFIEYDLVSDCKTASENIAGRKFADKIIIVSYFDPEKYANRKFS